MEKSKNICTCRIETFGQNVATPSKPALLKKSKYLSEPNDDLGKLNFRKHVVTKREKLSAERDEYEKKYLARYKKQQKTKRTKKK